MGRFKMNKHITKSQFYYNFIGTIFYGLGAISALFLLYGEENLGTAIAKALLAIWMYLSHRKCSDITDTYMEQNKNN